MSVRVPCPSCPSGVVVLHLDAWSTGSAVRPVRRCAWADEPLRCSRGCVLGLAAVERLLSTLYRQPAVQPALWFDDVAG